MIVLALTGSIGMGKSTTARLFADEGIPVNDADQVVHDLYSEGGEAVAPVGLAFPGVVKDGAVNRAKLSHQLAQNPAKFKELEAIVHPLVRKREKDFLDENKRQGEKLVVLDIPLLFETGGEKRVDKIAVVSCGEDEQRRRVLSRPGMTKEKLDLILSRQMPDLEKRARADFVIDTSHGVDGAREQVRSIIRKLKETEADA